MLKYEDVNKFFGSSLLKQPYQQSDFKEAVAALPNDSLVFLLDTCKILHVKRVFEFGSGRSTQALLKNGYSVTSLEDSEYWLNKTLENLSENEKAYHTTFVKPLKIRFLGLFPVMDWHIDSEIRQSINEADLILVDSPYYTPFRESTLWSSLKFANGSIIILDDMRIPTLQIFCDRIKNSNESLVYNRVSVGHGLGIFYINPGVKLILNHSFIDIIKGWYRFLQGYKFYIKLSK